MKMQRHKKVIISGGGTGGHIFPALSIANSLKRLEKDIEILFVGARGRMEMDRVPEAGYRIEGLPVEGFIRRLSIKNIAVLIRLFKSIRMAKKIIRAFDPDVVVGVGGYASGPVLWVSGRMMIPTLIQEQNSYAGLTNRILSRRASVICVAYEGMEKYFPTKKIMLAGNPVRREIKEMKAMRGSALQYFNLKKDRPVVLVLGGSLGSATINQSIANGLTSLQQKNVQIIWQTGRYYFDSMEKIFEECNNISGRVLPFIDRMDYAFTAADVIISRAGAGTISELYIVAKPVILVPSPNVAEDHQTKNAQALVKRDAAILVTDAEAEKILIKKIIGLIEDEEMRSRLSAGISKLAISDSDNRIAEEIIKLT